MANGPLGGNMGTPPVPPQPPQVSFETTAQSRGNFNNFLKSMPNTTSMTPIPPMGSSPMMPAPNPMANIDIFNQPPSMGMGMMGMNQPPMNPMMQQPMQQPMNMGVGLMGTPVQNFYNGGGVDDFSDFGGFSDSSDPFGGSSDLSDPSIGSDSSFNEENFQAALDNLNLGSDDQAFADDPAIVDRRGINVGLENTGGFTAGVVPNLRGERFARFEFVPFAQRALGRDFQTKIGNNPNLTAGDYFETFTPSSENPGGTGNRMAEFTKATGKGPNDILSLNDINNIMDIQGKYEAGIRNNPAGQIEKISTTVPMNDDKQIANILDNLDLSKDLALDKEPEAFDMFGNPMSELTGQRGVSISNQAMQQKVDNDLADRAFSKGNFSMIGSADPDMDALERSIANTQRANEIQNQLANVNNQTLADRVQNQRGLGIDISTIPDISLENIMSSNISKEDPNKATVTQNISPQNTADRISRNNRNIDEIKADMGSRVPDTALETMAGRVGPTDTVFDIDTTDTRNFVGDDFDTALNLVDRNEADRLAAGQAMGVGTAPNLQNLTSTAMGRGQNVTRSIAPEDFEEKVGRDFNANRMADIERLYGEDVGQTKAGRGSDPTFFEDKGFTGTAGGILDAIERKTRENMANEIALGRPMGLGETFFGFNAPDLRTQTMKDYMSNVQPNYDFGDFNQTSKSIPEKQLVRNNSGRVIGIRDASGRLVSGMDPNAPMGSDDNNENPLILRPIAKAEEEEKEEEKLPNVIGGGDPITLPTPKSVVVDSPFTSNVSDFVPSTFNTGDINKLIEMLTGVAAPKSMKKGGVAGYAEGGRVMQALDNLLATA